WYIVQIGGATGLSISEQMFQPEGQARIVDVLTYTRERCGVDAPPWVLDLDPMSAAIIYRYPGNRKERYGALDLCKLTLSTADPGIASLHRHAILDPGRRFARNAEIVEQRFQRARLGDQPIRVAADPLEVNRRVFPIPPQRFGGDRVLSV